MARLFRHPDLPNYFESVDYEAFRADPRGTGDRIARMFEEGKVVVLENFRVDFDVDFFSTLDLANNRSAKKLKSDVNPDGTVDARKMMAHLGQCCDDEAVRQRFQAEATRVADQIVPMLLDIFPDQHFSTRRCAWRMLETVHEDLHVDIYPEEVSDFQIRLFVNLDRGARIWHTSYPLDDLFAKFGAKLSDEELGSLGPTAIIARLNKIAFGGLTRAGLDGQPRHTAYFDSGEVWLVDSRKISHQIFYGRRAVSLDFLADPARMNDPSTYYLNAVDRYRAARGIEARLG